MKMPNTPEQWDEFESEQKRKAGFDIWNADAVQLREHIRELRSAILAILDAADYTSGNCRANDMVGAVLDRVLIVKARAALRAALAKQEGRAEG